MNGQRDNEMARSSSAVQTSEQRRAANALRAVHDLDADEKFRQRYRSYVERLGPSILVNGLGQALATERAAAGLTLQKVEQRAHDRLYRNVQAWLCRTDGIYQDADVLQAIVGHGQAEYLRAQRESLAWLVWHKKFCRAYLPSPDPSEDD